MHKFGGRKIFLFGFIAMLLIGIPVTVYMVQRQQETRTRAEKSTNLTFTPESSANAPIQKSVGDTIPLDVFVDPGTNLVSFVKLEISYDPEKLATASADAFTQNAAVFPSVLEGPIFSSGKISVTLSVGPDPTKAIQTKSKAATISFKALSNTPPGQPTVVSYGATTQALSIGFNDQASENVLSSATPATIAIGGTTGPTEPVPTEALSPTQTPTSGVTPSLPPVLITPTIGTSPSANLAPVCSLLAVDKAPSGDAPLTLTFTATGTDADDTVSKVTFNFGDGGVIDVTDAGGVGTASVSAQATHTYDAGGTFTATAILTDSKNAVSVPSGCKQTVTVAASSSATEAPTAAPTLEPTGSTEVAMAIGAVLVTVIIGGGFLFFFL